MFTVYAHPNNLDQARLGVTVSRRIARRANRRNRLKRLIRESFRIHRHALGALDVVVIAREPANLAPAATLRASLDLFWTRLR